MLSIREPVLSPVEIADLKPTQITVGMREVKRKRKHLRSHVKKSATGFYQGHMIPVVLGPREQHYVIDHHHLARAMLEEKFRKIFVTVVADLSMVEEEVFWIVLDNRAWLHPFDAKGRRRSYREIPDKIGDLVDDPYRSLAGDLRRAGGFAKDTTPFSEFLWADYLRRRISKSLAKKEPDSALAKALVLAKSKDAEYLPGWCGPVSGD